MAQTSRNVSVGFGTARVLVGLGLFPDERFLIEYTLDPGCCPDTAAFAAYHENGEPVVLDETHNPIILWVPGTYRLIPDGELNERADVMVGAPFVFNISASPNNTGGA